MRQSKYIHCIQVASAINNLAELLHLENRNSIIQAAICHHGMVNNDIQLCPEALDILAHYGTYCDGEPITYRTPLGTTLLILAHYFAEETLTG